MKPNITKTKKTRKLKKTRKGGASFAYPNPDPAWTAKVFGTEPPGKGNNGYVGSGSFKTVRHLSNSHVLINSSAKQKHNKYLMMDEFNFIRIMGGIFPGLCVNVAEINNNTKSSRMVRKFVYSAERAHDIPLTNLEEGRKFIQETSSLLTTFLDHNFVYIDIKPKNFGMINGKIVVLDLDPLFCYSIPLTPRFRKYFVCVQTILLLGNFYYTGKIPIDVRRTILKEHKTVLLKDGICLEELVDVFDIPLNTATMEYIKTCHKEWLVSNKLISTSWELDKNDPAFNPIHLMHHYFETHLEPIPNYHNKKRYPSFFRFLNPDYDGE